MVRGRKSDQRGARPILAVEPPGIAVNIIFKPSLQNGGSMFVRDTVCPPLHPDSPMQRFPLGIAVPPSFVNALPRPQTKMCGLRLKTEPASPPARTHEPSKSPDTSKCTLGSLLISPELRRLTEGKPPVNYTRITLKRTHTREENNNTQNDEGPPNKQMKYEPTTDGARDGRPGNEINGPPADQIQATRTVMSNNKTGRLKTADESGNGSDPSNDSRPLNMQCRKRQYSLSPNHSSVSSNSPNTLVSATIVSPTECSSLVQNHHPDHNKHSDLYKARQHASEVKQCASAQRLHRQGRGGLYPEVTIHRGSKSGTDCYIHKPSNAYPAENTVFNSSNPRVGYNQSVSGTCDPNSAHPKLSPTTIYHPQIRVSPNRSMNDSMNHEGLTVRKHEYKHSLSPSRPECHVTYSPPTQCYLRAMPQSNDFFFSPTQPGHNDDDSSSTSSHFIETYSPPHNSLSKTSSACPSVSDYHNADWSSSVASPSSISEPLSPNSVVDTGYDAEEPLDLSRKVRRTESSPSQPSVQQVLFRMSGGGLCYLGGDHDQTSLVDNALEIAMRSEHSPGSYETRQETEQRVNLFPIPKPTFFSNTDQNGPLSISEEYSTCSKQSMPCDLSPGHHSGLSYLQGIPTPTQVPQSSALSGTFEPFYKKENVINQRILKTADYANDKSVCSVHPNQSNASACHILHNSISSGDSNQFPNEQRHDELLQTDIRSTDRRKYTHCGGQLLSSGYTKDMTVGGNLLKSNQIKKETIYKAPTFGRMATAGDRGETMRSSATSASGGFQITQLQTPTSYTLPDIPTPIQFSAFKRSFELKNSVLKIETGDDDEDHCDDGRGNDEKRTNECSKSGNATNSLPDGVRFHRRSVEVLKSVNEDSGKIPVASVNPIRVAIHPKKQILLRDLCGESSNPSKVSTEYTKPSKY